MYISKGTLSSTITDLNKVSDKQIFNAAESYIQEVTSKWENSDDTYEYACVKVQSLVDYGYFTSDEVSSSIEDGIKITRDISSKVISKVDYDIDCK